MDKEKWKKYYLENKKILLERNRQYRIKNRDKYLEYQRQYYYGFRKKQKCNDNKYRSEDFLLVF